MKNLGAQHHGNRKRVQLVATVCVAFIGSSIAILAFAVNTALSGFRKIEESTSKDEARRVQSNFDQIAIDLHRNSLDWISQVQSTKIADFSKSIINANQLSLPSVDKKSELQIFVFDENKNLRLRTISETQTQLATKVGTLVRSIGSENVKQYPSNFDHGIQGIVDDNEALYLFSLRQVAPVSSQKDRVGWVVFLRKLDGKLLSELNASTGYNSSIRITKLGDQLLNGGGSVGYEISSSSSLQLVNQIFVRNSGEVVQLITPRNRTAVQFGTQLIFDSVSRCLVLIFALGATAAYLWDRKIRNKMTSLSEQLVIIGDDPKGKRLDEYGFGESNLFISQVNQMIARLEQGQAKLKASEEALREHNENLEKTIEDRTQEIRYLALHDHLTSLPNRTLFFDKLKKAIKGHDSERGYIGVFFIDLDNFKVLNDSFGHEVGDDLLVEIAERITSVVGQEHSVARLGGDEFTVLIDRSPTVESITETANAVLVALQKPLQLGTYEVFTNASLGVAVTNDPSKSVIELVKEADAAMYGAKRAGKANVMLFNESMRTQATERLELEALLRSALKNEELHLVYQPIIDLETSKVAGAEALLRWVSPVKGFVPPSEFIPIAEECGLISEIGNYVLRKACQETKTWIDRYSTTDFVMSVNVSGKQILKGDIVGIVENTLKETGVPSSQLCVELTESTLMEYSAGAAQQMKELKDLGVKLALDDFGTGFSSLSTLSKYPIDKIKIDRNFVMQMETDYSAYGIVEAIVSMAHALKLSITAEGIEEGMQGSMLRSLGCQHGQGYYYSKPLISADFEKILDQSFNSEQRAA